MALAMTVTACVHKAESTDRAITARPTEVEMPDIPETLTTPRERADYLALHFWDKLDFNDTSLSLDTAFMEQSFSNFISVLPLCSPDALSGSVNKLLDNAYNAPAGIYDNIQSLATHYLWEAESPFISEELYLYFINYAIAIMPDGNPTAEGRREIILRNRPGQKAPDFTVNNRDGHTVKLSSSNGASTILMFYEPDCEKCNTSIEMMRNAPSVEMAIASGRLRLLLVYDGDDYDHWSEHASTLPASWEVTIDRDGMIDRDDLYIIRATPSFYLISADGTIVLKDAPLSQIAHAIGI